MKTAVVPSRLHHIALEVADMDKSIAFYRDLFGARLTERHAAGEVEQIPVELAFLRFNDNHHDLVLAHNPAKIYRRAEANDTVIGLPGFHHYGVEYADRDSWLAQLEYVRDNGFQLVRGPVVHSPHHPRGEGSWGENESFYVLDPDGHRVEMFCDMGTVAADGAYIDAYGAPIADARADEV